MRAHVRYAQASHPSPPPYVFAYKYIPYPLTQPQRLLGVLFESQNNVARAVRHSDVLAKEKTSLRLRPTGCEEIGRLTCGNKNNNTSKKRKSDPNQSPRHLSTCRGCISCRLQLVGALRPTNKKMKRACVPPVGRTTYIPRHPLKNDFEKHDHFQTTKQRLSVPKKKKVIGSSMDPSIAVCRQLISSRDFRDRFSCRHPSSSGYSNQSIQA